ncbi:MAG: hypothetical protein SF097_24540 [Acidobacteriota bacterium]|nr:hypothetical protein [Acidobacteriota bacterium]
MKLKRLTYKLLLIVSAMTCAWAFSPGLANRQDQFRDGEVIGYRSAGKNDAIARLQRRINSGEIKLEHSDSNGYLASVLKQLNIPVSSQGLVFSKTSFQLHRISPNNPRSIFFSDEAYVGWVRGGDLLELAAVDPQFGGVFYMLEQHKADKPRFVRNDECLQCHTSNATRNVPGFVVRSVYPDERGYPIAPLGSHITNHASPLIERWGGWYVTGKHGEARHAGNLLFSESSNPEKPEQLTGANLTSLAKKFTPTSYLSAHSDIVALMVLEHQTQMHNLITRLNYETKLALNNQKVMDEALQRNGDELSDSTRRRIERATEDLLRYMLFVGETRWQSPISGTTSFAKDFVATAQRDKQGRSLRDLDLQKKLFRYPCSYLIYSEAFDALPKPALDHLYKQLWLALTSQTKDKDVLAIAPEDRKAVLEILRQTKTNLPAYFQRDN